MLTAKDIMTRDVITIHYSASIRELSRLLAENKITGIPVIDDDKRLVGMISMRDLIREEVRMLGASPEYQALVMEAFLLALDSCALCTECPGDRAECKHPRTARPTSEAMGVDVFTTVRQCGYPIEVLSDYGQAMNRYAFLLIE